MFGLRHIPVPVVTGLRPALHRLPVHLHQTEMLGVPEPPFEVVEQGPDEIALQVGAVLDGAVAGQQVVADEEDPRAVLRLPGRSDPVAICCTVLGHIDRDVAVVVAEIDKLLVQPVGLDRPAHVGVFGPLRRRPEIGAEQPARIDHLMHAAIVVEPQEIDRLANCLHVPRLDQRLEVGDQAVGVLALEQRVQARPVPHRVPLRGGVPVGIVARRRLDRLNAEHGAELPVLRPHRPKRRERPPLGKVLVVDRGAVVVTPPQIGRVAADAMAEDRDDRGLVQHHPVLRAVAEPPGDDLRVIGEPVGDVAVGPAAAILKRLRQVPVIQAGPRLDAATEQRIDQTVVEIQPLGIRRPRPGRLNARPRDGEPVGLQPGVGHQRDVFQVAVVVVGRDIAGIVVEHLARRMAERIPDARPPAVGGGGAFDLIGRRGRTPQEAIGKADGLLGRSREMSGARHRPPCRRRSARSRRRPQELPAADRYGALSLSRTLLDWLPYRSIVSLTQCTLSRILRGSIFTRPGFSIRSSL